jgi:hypothetical protein
MTLRLLIPLLLSTVAFAQDPIDRLVGIWKPVEGLKAPNWTSVQWTLTRTGPYSAHLLQEMTLKSGEKRQLEATVVCDGKQHSDEVRSSPFFVSPKGGTGTCDPKTLSFRSDLKGQVMDSEAKVSADEKTLTYRRKLRSADGKQTEETIVFAKQ